jgi:hypothetical protein
VAYDKTGLSAETLRQYLNGSGHPDAVIEPIKPTIEDCFMELMVG